MPITEQQLDKLRNNVQSALNEYEAGLKSKLNETPRGSGQAVNNYDHLQASLTQTRSAKRVLYMEG